MSKIKNSIMKLWSFITSNYLQSILGFIAFLSWYEAYDLGHKSNSYRIISYSKTPSAPSPITSGYDGGALAMGLITCACLISIVWLEVNKSKLHK